MAVPSFLFGGDTGLTQEQLAQRRRVLEAVAARGLGAPKNVGEGLAAIGNAIAYRAQMSRLGKGEAAAKDRRDAIMAPLFSSGSPSLVDPNASASAAIPDSAVAGEIAATDPAADVGSNGPTFSPFIDTVKSGVKLDDGTTLAITNPYGLAAVAATGKAESGWSPKNASGSWSDPSESGQAGTAGGVMSWRADRLRNLQAYAASKGEQGNGSPTTQAEFFLREDPNLVARLNAAKSPEEAQSLMNGAWKFAGYDRPGGEAGRRLSYANAYLSQFQGNEVASLDPSVGMPPAAAAIEAQAPGSGYVDPMVSAPNYDPVAAGAPVAGGREAVANALAAAPQKPLQFSPAVTTVGNAMAGKVAPGTEMPPLPPGREVGAPPAIAGVPPQQVAGNGYFPPAPPPPSAGPSLPQLYQMATSPDVTEQDRALVNMMIEQRMQEADPLRQLQMQKLQREVSAPIKRETTTVNGRLIDNQTGQVIAEYPDQVKPTTNQQDYQYYRDFEIKNGRTPLGPLEWEQAQRKAGATTVNNNIGETDKFYENLDKKNAEMFASLSDGGVQARGKLGQINRLEGLFANVPQGIEGGFKKLAGDWGVAIGEGTSDIQAASALIERMVPEQRAPGTGPMSDSDIKMFRASLPRVLNQPGGNQLIFQTLRGIAEYEVQMGEIADAVADRSITPAEGRKRIRELRNPLEDYKIPEGSTPNEGFKTNTGVQWSIE